MFVGYSHGGGTISTILSSQSLINSIETTGYSFRVPYAAFIDAVQHDPTKSLGSFKSAWNPLPVKEKPTLIPNGILDNFYQTNVIEYDLGFWDYASSNTTSLAVKVTWMLIKSFIQLQGASIPGAIDHDYTRIINNHCDMDDDPDILQHIEDNVNYLQR